MTCPVNVTQLLSYSLWPCIKWPWQQGRRLCMEWTSWQSTHQAWSDYHHFHVPCLPTTEVDIEFWYRNILCWQVEYIDLSYHEEGDALVPGVDIFWGWIWSPWPQLFCQHNHLWTSKTLWAWDAATHTQYCIFNIWSCLPQSRSAPIWEPKVKDGPLL